MQILSPDDQEKIQEILRDLKQDRSVCRMKHYVQHGSVSTYDHCERVAKCSYAINKRLRLGADEKTLLRGAMLHDFYLYDWHCRDGTHPLHGFRHADTAADNAVRHFGVGKKEQQIIRSHMWPLNLTHVPKNREAWIVCFADKYCSLIETLFRR